MSKKTTKPPIHTKNNLLQARVDLADFQEILTKAQMYAKGNLSEYVRMAALGYRPLKRKDLG